MCPRAPREARQEADKMDSDDEEDLYRKDTTETTPLTDETTSLTQENCCGITPWLLFTTLVCIFGSSFQFGYNLAVINAPEQVIKDYFESHNVTMTKFMWSTAVSITAIGGLIGALIGPAVADMCGRKSTLLWNNAVIILGCIFMFLSHTKTSPALLIIGRLIVGINNGINTVVVPMFLAEISPTRLRGALGTSNQFGIVTGQLVAYILGLHQILGTHSGWPYLLTFSTVVAVIQVFTLPFCPSSPRYLLIKLNKEYLARQDLRKLQGSYNIENVIIEMKREKEHQASSLSILQLLKSRSLRFSLIISVVLQMSQQFSGINSIFYYSTSTFEKAEISDPDAATCGLGVTSVVMVAIALVLVERLGRRSLMLTGLAGMFVSYGLMTLGFALQGNNENMKYLSLVCTFLLLTFFQIGPGPIPWFMMSELFAQVPRPAATSISGAVNWFANFIVGISFPTIQSLLYPYVFVVFMVLIIAFWLFIYFYVPETKGKTFEQISEELQNSYEHSINNID